VKELFEKSESNGSSILFFDEFESIVPVRYSSTAAVMDRIVNQYLCYLDGVIALEKTFVVAATAWPDMIDPAIIRPGRIDSHISLDLPGEEDRIEFFAQKLQEYGVALKNADHDIIAEASAGFSYAHMELSFKNIETAEEGLDSKKAIRCLIQDLGRVKPISLSNDFSNFQRIFDSLREHKTIGDLKHQKHVLE
jgi:SpoVK/Ycf46/Vps4 family AAA+-type ATPase